MMLHAHEYYAEAIFCYAKAKALDRGEFRWPYFQALLLETSDKEAALESFREAIEVRPRIAQLRVRRAELLMDMGRPQEAEEELRQSIALASTHLLARYRMAQLMLQKAEYEDGLLLAIEVAREKPDSRAVTELLIQLHVRLGNRQEAEELRARLPDLPSTPEYWRDPYIEEITRLRRDPRYLAYQAERLFRQGKVTESVELLERLVQEHQADWTFREQLARTYVSLNDLEQAAQVLEDGIRLIPDSPEMHRLRGAVHVLQEEWQKGAVRFRNALELKVDDAASHQDLAYCLMQLGALDESIAELREAIRYKPDSVEARLAMAQLLLRREDWEHARAELQEVLDLSPKNPAALKLLELANGGQRVNTNPEQETATTKERSGAAKKQ